MNIENYIAVLFCRLGNAMPDAQNSQASRWGVTPHVIHSLDIVGSSLSQN